MGVMEASGDLWTYQPADARVITTNAVVGPGQPGRRKCVMGRGVARQARDLFPGIDATLGHAILLGGNHCHALGQYAVSLDQPPFWLVSFPVKDAWWEPAYLELITRSAFELRVLANTHGWRHVVLPRAGCGNGGLRWDSVRPILTGVLNERFTVLDYDR